MGVHFSPGHNLAMKVPVHEFEATVAFYRDILHLDEVSVGDRGSSVVFAFGDKRLWIDPAEGMSQAELWLEIMADDVEAAAVELRRAGCVRRDGIEALPEDFNGFWISSPANIIHLVAGAGS